MKKADLSSDSEEVGREVHTDPKELLKKKKNKIKESPFNMER